MADLFRSVLVANRGEIAARVFRTCRRLGIEAIGVASDADRFTQPMLDADRVMRLGPGPVAATYLNADAIIAACKESSAQAVHPGYGFLSENTDFAERLAATGIAFIGPRPDHIRAFGLKHTARALAAQCGVKLLPGSGLLASMEEAVTKAQAIGYPVMLKSTAGGGGIGILLCRDEAELCRNFAGVAQLASGNFGDARLYLERFVSAARHVEVQIFGDGKGGILTLGTRDCSAQRRNQKVIEETPAPNLSEALRAQLRDAATALGKAVNYESAGTVEFIYDVARDDAYFLEVNTRLQVEHPVTEEVFGVDLIEWMIRQASGDFVLPDAATLTPRGHAIEARIYAENPAQDFRPATGIITAMAFAPEARLDGWIAPGTEISSFYDPMLAKLIVKGETRAAAMEKLRDALARSQIWGVETNLAYLAEIAALSAFAAGTITTATLKTLPFRPRSVEVLAPGAQSSLQDWPGRLGHWDVGIPPSGPMDSRSHRLVNRLVGNAENAAVLECTFTGPSLRFLADSLIALGGAEMEATLDGAPMPNWQATAVKAG
ncbi:MAG TPA: biotin carboxylase N-terminal domain-containing protein, partial [Rhizomicrobium sp.]